MQVFHNHLNWVLMSLSKEILYLENKVQWPSQTAWGSWDDTSQNEIFSVIPLMNRRDLIAAHLLLRNSLLHFLMFLGHHLRFLWQIALLLFWENTDRKFGGSVYRNQEPFFLPGNSLMVSVKFVMVSQSLDRFTWAVFFFLVGDQLI